MMQTNPVALMYHGIVSNDSDTPPEREAGAGIYDVNIEEFREQMQYAQEQKFVAATLDGVLAEGKERVVVTFDDGEQNNFQYALPVLRELGFQAYFFITVKRVGAKGYMDWEQIKELRDADMAIGSHGLHHEIMLNYKDKELARELSESKATLEQNLKINIDSLSVPRGFYDERILRMAHEAGYKNIFVSDGRPRLSGCIGRVAVRRNWSLSRFDEALRGKLPVGESVAAWGRDLTKRMLGHRLYDRMRKRILGAQVKIFEKMK
ncbi:MAG: polysaccharide deacetylase family protein [Candidatus Omnitrophota bacterium]